MPTYLTEAFTLRTFPLGETDRIVVLFTPEGIRRVVAKGARKTGSSLGGRTEPLLRTKVLLAKGKSMDIISQCETLEAFPALRRELPRLLHGLSLAELTMACLGESEQAYPELFELFGTALKALCEAPPALVALWFELQLLQVLGYAPSLETCVQCGTPVEGECRFSLSEGGVLCPRCAGGSRLTAEAHGLLLRLQEGFPSFPVEDAVLANAQNILRGHLEQRLETRLKATVLL